MVLPLLASLALSFQGSDSTVAATPRAESHVTVRLSDSSFARGQRARVYVELGSTAHLLVLHINGDGRIRILFPLRPMEDALVPGGQWYELPGADAREAIAVDEREGNGTVLAARSGVPFGSTLLASGDDWDYGGALLLQPTGGDALAALLDIVERLADGGRTEMDVTTYVVNSQGAPSQVTAAGAMTAPSALWPSVRHSPYPGSGRDRATDSVVYGDSTATAPITINATCANSYVETGAVCGSVLYNPTFVQSESERQPYPDAFTAGGYYPYYDPFLLLLLSRRIRMVEPPVASPPLPPARVLPRPPRPSRVRVITPALPKYPPLPPPRRPIPVAAIGARIRAPINGEAPQMASARPPVTSVTRPMPAEWTRRRPATAAGAAAIVATAAAPAARVVRRQAGAAMVTPAVGAPAASGEATRIISRVPLGVSMGSRPLATRRPASAATGAATGARAYRHPIRVVRPHAP